MSLEMVPAKVGGDSRASNEPWATSPERGTQTSTATLRAVTTHQALSHWPSQWRYLPTQYVRTRPMREGREEGKAEQLNDLLPETNCPSHSRNKQHVRFDKPRMSPEGAWIPDHRWPALALAWLSLNYI